MQVAGTRSSQTVCQMPVVRGYQMECGWSCQSCLPRGFERSAGSSWAQTTTVCSALGIQVGGDVGEEGRVAAFVLGRELSVHPDLGAVVDRAEVEDQAVHRNSAWERRTAAVPAGAVKPRVVDAAGRGLGREGDADALGPGGLVGGRPKGVRVEGELPFAIQVGPFGAFELGSGISMQSGQSHSPISE